MALTSNDLARLGPRAQRQILTKLGQAAKTSKYHNEPCVVGKIRFDSKKEARRYEELMALMRAGKIRSLRLQPQYTLQESCVTPEGERVRAIRYVADFAYERPTEPDCTGKVYWIPVVEDVKSKATRTAQYEIKRKLMWERYGIEIMEV